MGRCEHRTKGAAILATPPLCARHSLPDCVRHSLSHIRAKVAKKPWDLAVNAGVILHLLSNPTGWNKHKISSIPENVSDYFCVGPIYRMIKKFEIFVAQKTGATVPSSETSTFSTG